MDHIFTTNPFISHRHRQHRQPGMSLSSSAFLPEPLAPSLAAAEADKGASSDLHAIPAAPVVEAKDDTDIPVQSTGSPLAARSKRAAEAEAASTEGDADENTSTTSTHEEHVRAKRSKRAGASAKRGRASGGPKVEVQITHALNREFSGQQVWVVTSMDYWQALGEPITGYNVAVICERIPGWKVDSVNIFPPYTFTGVVESAAAPAGENRTFAQTTMAYTFVAPQKDVASQAVLRERFRPFVEETDVCVATAAPDDWDAAVDHAVAAFRKQEKSSSSPSVQTS